jgi:Secretion system C-terminal sorting domain
MADYWVVSLDSNGTVINQNTIGTSENDVMNSVYQSSDGTVILGGQTAAGIDQDKNEESEGDNDVWMVALNALLEVEDYLIATTIRLYPNPSVQNLNIAGIDGLATQYEVYSNSGVTVATGLVENNSVDVSQFTSGTYLIRLKNEQGTVTKQFIKR